MQVLQTRMVNRQGESMKQMLIQWQEGGIEVATWEDTTTIQEQFPEYLEDKVDFEEGSNIKESEN